MKTGQTVRGSVRLVFDAVDGVTRIVEEMYRNIALASPPIGRAPQGPAPGMAGLVHAAIRQVSGATRVSLDALLEPFTELMDGAAPPGPAREAVIAAVNGVVGDHLKATGNPLAIPLQFRGADHARLPGDGSLREALPGATCHLLLTVHGSCMNDRQWTRNGYSHVRALSEAHGLTPVHLLYNSGLHISENGRELAHALQRLADRWPVPLETVTLLCLSMGGLVCRSAAAYAEEAGLAWRARLRTLVFLGTPHLGSYLERGGHWVNTVAEWSPYTAPLARLGWLRSAGITDLRHGSLRDEDWQGRDRFRDPLSDVRPVPLPVDVRCIAAAATRSASLEPAGRRLLSDGLVPVASALGRSGDARRRLDLAEGMTAVFTGLNHWGLLDDPRVSAFLLERAAPDSRTAPGPRGPGRGGGILVPEPAAATPERGAHGREEDEEGTGHGYRARRSS